jgi:hypothetical protein
MCVRLNERAAAIVSAEKANGAAGEGSEHSSDRSRAALSRMVGGNFSESCKCPWGRGESRGEWRTYCRSVDEEVG